LSNDKTANMPVKVSWPRLVYHLRWAYAALYTQ